ncbi:MAG TPA: class II fructose-bisphosphatase [Terriglobales bacterium]|nr:class II fructose-bisphosphatase [Terriglobales bacterium]
MATKVQTEEELLRQASSANFESDLALEFLRVVEESAIAAAKTMGQGDRKRADLVATEAMRRVMDSVPMDGTIVIGEGERDEAPMLYIGEKVGKRDGGSYPQVDIAVDPLEGTNLCATGSPGSITVLAASEKGGLLHAPDCYMEKIVVGPSCKGVVDLEAPVSHNLNVIAKVLDRRVEDLVIVILDRPRHEKLINEVRKAGARIRLISDGDLAPGVAASMLGSGVHAVMGAGGAPEGVVTAAAVRCLNAYMVGRLTGYTPEQGERMKDMGITDPNRIYTAEELAPGKNIIFAATGVTDGTLLKGVRFFGDGVRTTSLVMKLSNRKVRFIETIHLERRPDVKVRIPER